MDHPPNPFEEAVESVNPRDQKLPASDPSESVKSESHAPAEPNEALLRISQDMARLLERLTTPKALIDMVCDALNPGCPLTTRQPAEIYTSRVTRHTHE